MSDVTVVGSGPNGNVEQQVDPTHQAARVSLRPLDHRDNTGRVGGQFRLSAVTGAVAGALAANAPIFSLRWANPNFPLVILGILASGKCEAFSSGVGTDLEAIVARSFTASDTGGTLVQPATTAQKMRSASMAQSLLANDANSDCRVASTAALSAGTRTLDTVGIGYVALPATGAGGGAGGLELFRAQSWEHALVLGQNEGLIVRSSSGFASSNTWRFGLTLIYAEVPCL